MKPWVKPLCALVTGVATLAITYGFTQLPEVKAAYPAGNFTLALSTFQRATSMDQLTALFGNPPDAVKLAAMTAGNSLDLYAYIPVYTIFLIWTALMLSQDASGKGRALQWFAIIAILIGCAGDVLETSSQLAISTDWNHAAAALPRVASGCWIKFFGIAVHALGCTALCLTGERKRWILGVLGVLPLIATAAEYLHLTPIGAALTPAFALFWVAVLVVALADLFRVTRQPRA
jgi:hypothetical protein